jgi:PAS domain S-box-containing protein
VQHWQRNLRSVLNIVSIVAAILALSFYYVDIKFHFNDIQALLIMRMASSGFIILNVLIARQLRTEKSLIVAVYIAGWLAVIHSTIQALISGGFNSPYWYGFSLVIIVWFVFLPLKYKYHILHGALFLLVHFVVLILLGPPYESFQRFVFQVFIVGGVFLLGASISIIANHTFAKIFYNERSTRESELKYRNLVENATDGIMILQDTKFLFINQTFITASGYSREELMKLTIKDLVAPEDQKRVLENHEKRMQGMDFRSVYTISVILKSGEKVPMELNTNTIDFNGKKAAFIIVRDNREQFKAKQALQESEERYRTIFNLVGDAIFLTRYNSRQIVDANDAACRVYGYSKDEFLNLTYGDLMDHANPSQNITNETNNYIYIPEQFHKRKDGSVLIVEVFGNFFRLNNEDLSIWVIHDYTEKKRLKQELEKSYSVLEQNYSHTLEQMQTYFSELQAKKSELLRLQKENLQSQFETLKSQVNPHFLFNSLNILSSLISVDTEMAENFTGNLSKIYRYVLEHQTDDLVTLQSELDFMRSYSFLLNTRFKDKLSFNINIPEYLLTHKIPPLSLQILIENAIKHNTFSVKSPLVIDIYISDASDLVIANNYQPRENKIESTGLGLNNIANRYSFFTDRLTHFGIIDGRFEARIPLL